MHEHLETPTSDAAPQRAGSAPGAGSAALLALQRLAGNRAVGTLMCGPATARHSGAYHGLLPAAASGAALAGNPAERQTEDKDGKEHVHGPPDGRRTVTVQRQRRDVETRIYSDDATVNVPANCPLELLGEIIRDHPVISRRLIYRSDRGGHAAEMLRERSNISEFHATLGERSGAVRMHFRFTYELRPGAEDWRVRYIEMTLLDPELTFQDDEVSPGAPVDLQDRIDRRMPPAPSVDMPPNTPVGVLREIGRIFWDPEHATSPAGLRPGMPDAADGLQAVIDYNLRTLRNGDAIQLSGAEYLGYADALARWATGTEAEQLTTVPPDMRQRMMGLSLSLAGYRSGALRAAQVIDGIAPESRQQGARFAIARHNGHTRARIREVLLGEFTSAMDLRVRCMMPRR